MSVAHNITNLREQSGLTRQELADAAGLTRSAILKIEKGDRYPNAHTLTQIAAALNVSNEDLLGSRTFLVLHQHDEGYLILEDPSDHSKWFARKV